MKLPEKYITEIATVINSWLNPGNADLKEAIDKTVEDGYFSFEDIKYQVLALKQTLQKKHLFEWADRAGLRHGVLKGKNIFCLHAGNLPLVGLQDALAVLMTGGNYKGKISRKDPYLLPSFLKKIQESGLPVNAVWNTEIQQLDNLKADALLFAGSEHSSVQVLKLLRGLNIISENTPKLMRTAHFSVALITDNSPETMQNLTEAVFRYGGAGCRSVAIVVAPFHLNAEKCSFTDYVESFWLKNPQHSKPTESLFHRFALNKAVKIEQAWLDDFLIEGSLSHPREKFVLHWVVGGKPELDEIVKRYSDGIQSVYSNGIFIGQNSGSFTIEPLSAAQLPPIWWKPDQVDTIRWLQESV